MNLPLVTISAHEPVTNAIALMRKYEISQVPVVDHDKFVGSLDDSHLIQVLLDDPDAKDHKVQNYMQPSFPVVQPSDPIDSVSRKISKNNGAVLVELGQGKYHIITRHDVVAAMT